MDSPEIPGLSIAVINDAEMVYHRTFGVKNIETGAAVNSSTIFEAASLSKPLSSYFVMKQIEKGVIGLDDPLYRYMAHPAIRDNDKRYELITPRMVLSHTTGFPNWSVDKPIEMKFTPGTGFSYSGEAHQYLTALLAVAQHTNWQEGLDSIFQQDVAKPLGMKRSFYVRNDYTTRHKATGYFKDGRVKDFWLDGSISFGGAHTLHTEAVDYARFLIAMINGEGLKKETFDEMLREYKDMSLTLVSSYIKDDQEAEDLLQEAFMKAFSNIHKFRFESQFATWFYRIVVNTCLRGKERDKGGLFEELSELESTFSQDVSGLDLLEQNERSAYTSEEFTRELMHKIARKNALRREFAMAFMAGCFCCVFILVSFAAASFEFAVLNFHFPAVYIKSVGIATVIILLNRLMGIREALASKGWR